MIYHLFKLFSKIASTQETLFKGRVIYTRAVPGIYMSSFIYLFTDLHQILIPTAYDSQLCLKGNLGKIWLFSPPPPPPPHKSKFIILHWYEYLFKKEVFRKLPVQKVLAAALLGGVQNSIA